MNFLEKPVIVFTSARQSIESGDKILQPQMAALEHLIKLFLRKRRSQSLNQS